MALRTELQYHISTNHTTISICFHILALQTLFNGPYFFYKRYIFVGNIVSSITTWSTEQEGFCWHFSYLWLVTLWYQQTLTMLAICEVLIIFLPFLSTYGWNTSHPSVDSNASPNKSSMLCNMLLYDIRGGGYSNTLGHQGRKGKKGPFWEKFPKSRVLKSIKIKICLKSGHVFAIKFPKSGSNPEFPYFARLSA